MLVSMLLAELKAWPLEACLRTVIRQVIIKHTLLLRNYA
jgi:hypothetical protein